MNYEIIETHVSEVQHGDTIVENGQLVTLDKKYIKNDPFIGCTIRDNSYNGGRNPVLKVVIKRAMPDGSFVNA